jgi:CO/xanthine dehydrogenase Mo-binding subunit
MQGGKAVYNAAFKAREELLRLGGHLLEVDSEDLELSGGVVRSKGHPGTKVSLVELADAFVVDELKQIGVADHIPPASKTDKETSLTRSTGSGRRSPRSLSTPTPVRSRWPASGRRTMSARPSARWASPSRSRAAYTWAWAFA